MLWSSRGFHSVKMSPHSHDMHELFICLNDSGVQHIAGKSCHFSRGACFLLHSGVPHNLSDTSPEKPGEFVFFCFDPGHFLGRGMDAVHRQIQRGKEAGCYFFIPDKDSSEKIIGTALRLHGEIESGGFLSAEMADCLLAELLVSFFRGAGQGGRPSGGGVTAKRIEVLCADISARPELQITLDKAAAMAGVCRAGFTRLFKERTGMTFCDFVNDRRLRGACRALENPDISVSAAALSSGFRNLGYFHRAFKARFGLTPLELRKLYRESGFPHLIKEYKE